MQPRHNVRRAWRAFTLVEAGIGLAIIGLAVSAIWVGANRVQRAVAITTLSEQVHQIADNVRGLYVSKRGMFVDNTQANVNGAPCGVATFNSQLSCLGAYPADIAAGGPGGDAYHVWDQTLPGGSVLILPRDINYAVAGVAPGADSFGIQLLNLPADVCTELVVRNSVPDQKDNLKAVLFYNGGALTTSYVTPSRPPDWTLGGTRTNILPLNPAQAFAACNAADAVEWVFALR